MATVLAMVRVFMDGGLVFNVTAARVDTMVVCAQFIVITVIVFMAVAVQLASVCALMTRRMVTGMERRVNRVLIITMV